MNKKHYIKVAAALARQNKNAQNFLDLKENDQYFRGQIVAIRDMANSLADMFAEDNPRFDRARFLSACGIFKP